MQKDNSLRQPAPGGLTESTVTTFEVGHEIGQRLHAGQRHGIVNRSAHAANYPVAFQRLQADGLGFAENTLSSAASASWNGTFIHERLAIATWLR